MRLYKTVQFIYSADMTFTISEFGLWCVTEILCTFLVFCLPSVPKIFIETRLMSKLASFFGFRTDNVSRTLEGGASSSRWPSIPLSSKNNYQKVDRSAHSLKPISQPHRTSSESQQELRLESGQERAITRTTEFTTRSEYVGPQIYQEEVRKSKLGLGHHL